MDALPALGDAQGFSLSAHSVLGHAQKLGQILVREAVLFSLDEESVGQERTLVGEDLFLLLDQLLHLLDEPPLHMGGIVDLLHGSALAEGLIHEEMPLAGGGDQPSEELLAAQSVEILHMSETVAAGLQAADGLLEGLLIILADAHDLTDGAHLGAQLVLDALELLKGPAGELDHDIVAVRDILVQGPVLAAGDILQGQAGSQHGRDHGDGETGRLRGQGGGTGGAGVDLDDDDAVRYGIMGELHVGAADDLHAVHDLVGLLLQTLLDLFGDGQHGGRAEGIAGMDAHGIDILDEADGDHIAVCVTDDLQLQLLPAEDGLLHQNLAHQGSLQTSGDDRLEFFLVVDETAAGAAHGVGGTQDHGIAQSVGDGETVLHTVGHVASGHLDAQGVHGLLEFDPVLAALDGIHLHADDLYAVLVKNAFPAELGAEVEAGLAAQIGEQGVGTLHGDDLLKTLYVQRFDIGDVCRLRVRHDGGGIGVDENDLISEFLQCLAGLCA